MSEVPGIEIPEDFNDFWAEAVAQAMAIPIQFTRSLRVTYPHPSHVVETMTFNAVGGRELHGWIAYPHGVRRNPGFLWIPPYGRESKLPDEYGTRDGLVSMSFNFHGHEAFHQQKYIVSRGYFGQGIGSPETWIFREMLQSCIIATRVLQAQLEVDENRLAAMGMSQGGGLAIWLGAWSPVIKVVCADMPFLGDIQNTVRAQVHRYPLKEVTDAMTELPLGEARVMNTLSYFDTASQASRCQKPTHVSLGLKDPACRPPTVRTIYEALPGPKELKVYDWGHDWHPDMIPANRDWLLHYL